MVEVIKMQLREIKIPEDVFELFHFLAARLVGFAVIQECPGVRHGTCVHLQRDKSGDVRRCTGTFSKLLTE